MEKSNQQQLELPISLAHLAIRETRKEAPGTACPGSGYVCSPLPDKDKGKIVDVGVRGPGEQQIVKASEKAIGIVVLQIGPGI